MAKKQKIGAGNRNIFNRCVWKFLQLGYDGATDYNLNSSGSYSRRGGRFRGVRFRGSYRKRRQSGFPIGRRAEQKSCPLMRILYTQKLQSASLAVLKKVKTRLNFPIETPPRWVGQTRFPSVFRTPPFERKAFSETAFVL